MKNQDINFADMVVQLAKPGIDILYSLTPGKCNLWHHATGVAGEMLEISIALRNNDKVNLVEEAGDLLFYLQGVLSCIGADNDIETLLREISVASDNYESLMHATESVVDQIKKAVIYNKPLEIEKLSSAVEASIFWLGVSICDNDKSPVDALLDAVDKNKSKLAKRYEGFTYSDKAAQDRKDKA